MSTALHYQLWVTLFVSGSCFMHLLFCVVLIWTRLGVCVPFLLFSSLSLSVYQSIHPSIPMPDKQRSSIPAVPAVKASVLWRAAHIVVRQSLALSGITQLDGGHCQGHSGLSGPHQNSRPDSPSLAMIAGQETNCIYVFVCLCTVGSEHNPKFTSYTHLFTRHQTHFLCANQISLNGDNGSHCCTKV